MLDALKKRGWSGTGTVRVNRLHNVPLPTKPECNKMVKHNITKIFSDDKCCLQWKDNNIVHLASNKYEAHPVGKSKRYDGSKKQRVEVPCPDAILRYNAHMGGVDLLDAAEKVYRIHFRMKKWYWCLYAWFLNISMVQAWRMYRRMNSDKEKLPLLDFVRDVVWETLHLTGSIKRPIALHQSPSMKDRIRFDRKDHLIRQNRKVRFVCQECKHRTGYFCNKCKVGLHPDCFYDYHTNT